MKESERAPASYRRLAGAVGGADAVAATRAALGPAFSEGGPLDLAVLLAVAYPALKPSVAAHPEDVVEIARGTLRLPRDARFYRRAVASLTAQEDAAGVRRALRVLARREKLRVAARELLPQAGCEIEVTSQELSDLAEACIGAALDEAMAWATARFGPPVTATGERCKVSVLGMGKLGGRELNAGSDVDLLVFYETDEGSAMRDGAETSLHEVFTRVTQRITQTLEEVTEDGQVWRVDLRLRPEGSRGPLVNALASAERYYESWGRTWERAALLRARPVAGDASFGKEVLQALAPFVWRRVVDPRCAGELTALVEQARAEAARGGGARDVGRDLKLGVGGIREAEFFVQALLLIWGGRHPRIRCANTLLAVKRLDARGFVTDREGRAVEDGYRFLRRLEHRVQFATGLQTHTLPEPGALLDRIARSMGFARAEDLEAALAEVRASIHRTFASLREGAPGSAPEGGYAELTRLFVALEAEEEASSLSLLEELLGAPASPELARHLFALARRGDAPLGARTRDRSPEFCASFVRAVVDAADPEQAACLFARFFSRFATPSVYVRALADDPSQLRRMANLFGASAFLGDVVVGHPEMADRLLFGKGAPTEEDARRAVSEEVALPGEATAREADAFVGATRRAKRRVLLEVGLSDLSGEIDVRGSTHALSALADASLEAVTRFAVAERAIDVRFAVIAMGKLGGFEIGYGSDLDLVFVYEPKGDPDEDGEKCARLAQRVLRLLGSPHDEGSGYELDTRLRPSGSHGLLVVSLEAFARYHGVGPSRGSGGQAMDWERQALVKARACAGDPELGGAFVALAHEAAYERAAPAAYEIHRMRTRMEVELGGERRKGRARYDLKLGRGGLADVEFAVQWLQMKHGADARVRSTETEVALKALEASGYLLPEKAAPLREGYGFLRRLEQRLRILHGGGAQLLEEGAPGLAPLARRMGIREPGTGRETVLLERYREVTEAVRAAYLAVLGLDEGT